MSYRLSKSTFQTGLQCQKALWLKFHDSQLADPLPASRQAIFDAGTAVGELARERFAGGILVAEDHTQSTQALETTRKLLEDPPAAIYEAAFNHSNVFVRPDVLVRVGPNEWDLYEVKSSTRVKPENTTDVAVQTWVLEGAGLSIRRSHLMHLDNTYVYEGGDYDLDKLFLAEDITEPIRAFMPSVATYVGELLAMLEGPQPEVPIGARCTAPYDCNFFGHCHARLPEKPVTNLPRLSAGLLESLVADGILAIADIPSDYPGLTSAQREVCELVRSGESRIVGDVARSLEGLAYPLHFLDFETFMSALPLFPGTRPYQAIPFQWSDHVLHENGDLEHREFLFEGRGDPRDRFTSSLMSALGDAGTVIVYSAYENTQLNKLAYDLPKYAGAIARVQERLFDLLPVVRQHVRHPDCLGSASIKVVLPALVEDLSYEGLAISEGNTASHLYLECQMGSMTADEEAELFANLRQYCGMDTYAMVRLLDALRAAGASPGW